jgi:hypothetical protein
MSEMLIRARSQGFANRHAESKVHQSGKCECWDRYVYEDSDEQRRYLRRVSLPSSDSRAFHSRPTGLPRGWVAIDKAKAESLGLLSDRECIGPDMEVGIRVQDLKALEAGLR